MNLSEPRTISIRAVIAGVGCGEHLITTLESWQAGLKQAGMLGEAVVIVAAGDRVIPRVEATGATVVEVPKGEALTPGANRNRGARGAGTEWICFVDGDVVLDPAFLRRGVKFLRDNAGVAGYAGRIDERHWKGEKKVGEIRDSYRIGKGGEVDILATVWLCRRLAFEQVGGFDPEMPSEEDFDLSLRLRRAGWQLWVGPELIAFHDCPPRPSLSEIIRRWRTGLFAGQGLALRKAWGTPLFGPLLARQRLYVGSLLYLALGLMALGAALAGQSSGLKWWFALIGAVWLLMSLRKRSLRLGFLSLLTWMVQGVALLRSSVFGPWGKMSDHQQTARGNS